MSRTLTAIFIFGIFGLLEAQQPSPSPQPTAIGVHVSEGPGAAFQFTKVDDNLRAEADAVDAEYEKRGLVLDDADLQAYIDSVGNRVLGGRPAPENASEKEILAGWSATVTFEGCSPGTPHLCTCCATSLLVSAMVESRSKSRSPNPNV